MDCGDLLKPPAGIGKHAADRRQIVMAAVLLALASATLLGAGVVITGSVVTAGAARTLFGKDPE